MSVVITRLLASGTKLGLDWAGRATVTHVYLVLTDSDVDGPYSVAIESTGTNLSDLSQIKLGIKIPPILVDGGGPNYLAQYNIDHGAGVTSLVGVNGTTDTCAWLLKKEVTRAPDGDEGNRRAWHVTCTWGPLPFGFAGGFGTAGTAGTAGSAVLPTRNPLNDPVIERSEIERYRKRLDFDINGSAIVNSAGDPIPVEIDDIRTVAVYTKNRATTAEIDLLASQYKNAINSDTFKGHLPGTLKIAGITKGPLQERSGIQFIPMIVKMHLAEVATSTAGTSQTWQVVRADRGGQVLEQVGTSSSYRKIYPTITSGTNSGQPLDYVNLNSDGTRKADGLGPNQKSFDVYYSLPFSGLGLN